MECEGIKELLSAFLDGELTEEESSAVRAHLERCPDCRKEIEAFRKVSALYRDLEDPEPPADLEERVLAEVGGLRVSEPAADLAVAVAIASKVLACTNSSGLASRPRASVIMRRNELFWSQASTLKRPVPSATLRRPFSLPGPISRKCLAVGPSTIPVPPVPWVSSRPRHSIPSASVAAWRRPDANSRRASRSHEKKESSAHIPVVSRRE